MSDLIEREAVLDAICGFCKFETDAERRKACANCLDVKKIKAIPPAEVIPKGSDEASLAYAEGWKNGEEAERSRKPKREWASVLAELHEQFFALEKEIRKASAEMSAVIREYVDRPKGEWILECDAEGEDDNLYRCSECGCNYGCQEYDIPNFCPNCGADMRGREDE